MGISHSANFTQCGIEYMKNPDLIAKYGYDGPTPGIPHNRSTQITYHGCQEVCGQGIEFYPWQITSATITTWILPTIGVLLQAPFESNAFRRTFLAITRWIGSPIASLSYTLWNIRVSGKCATIVDMAIKYEDRIPDPDSDFASIRDSFYLLATMNQFTMREDASRRKEAEGLLRIVLFSKDLRLSKPDENLKEIRRRYAEELRAGRRRSVVPVFISTLWFLFSLVISIQTAFGSIGENSTAHDLALGLLLAWLPVMILCSIIDRNPVAPRNMRKKLNKLIDKVREALMDDDLRAQYLKTFRACGLQKQEELSSWVIKISAQAKHMDNFFTDFAGQGRVRWHYGAAHPILSDIEQCYIAERGRDWLHDEDEARCELVLGETKRGLIWFDLREFWQILTSFLIVFGTILGAWFLSFFTPTVGLGCRSGGYTFFTVIATTLMLCEMLVWWRTSETSLTDTVQSKPMNPRAPVPTPVREPTLGASTKSQLAKTPAASAIWRKWCNYLFATAESGAKEISTKWHASSARERWNCCFFRPFEIVNTLWLLCIIFGQTLGAFQNCDCMTSSWGTKHGYMDFTQWNTTNSPWTRWYWASGTGIATATMGLAMVYLVIEWCTQSHLNTENYTHAVRGLRRTRRFKRMTQPFSKAFWSIANPFKLIGRYRHGPAASNVAGQRSLKWTKEVTYQPRLSSIDQEMTDNTSLPSRTPTEDSSSQLLP